MENGRPVFRVTVRTQLMLDEVQKGYISTIDNRAISVIEHLAEQSWWTCAPGLTPACSAGCDGVQVGARLAMSDPAGYAAVKADWNRAFSASVIQAVCHCRITKINDNSIRE